MEKTHLGKKLDSYVYDFGCNLIAGGFSFAFRLELYVYIYFPCEKYDGS